MDTPNAVPDSGLFQELERRIVHMRLCMDADHLACIQRSCRKVIPVNNSMYTAAVCEDSIMAWEDQVIDELYSYPHDAHLIINATSGDSLLGYSVMDSARLHEFLDRSLTLTHQVVLFYPMETFHWK